MRNFARNALDNSAWQGRKRAAQTKHQGSKTFVHMAHR